MRSSGRASGVCKSGIVAEHTRLASECQHSFTGRVRSRFSENQSSDVVEVSGRYSRRSNEIYQNLGQGIGFSHVSFGGNAVHWHRPSRENRLREADRPAQGT